MITIIPVTVGAITVLKLFGWCSCNKNCHASRPWMSCLSFVIRTKLSWKSSSKMNSTWPFLSFLNKIVLKLVLENQPWNYTQSCPCLFHVELSTLQCLYPCSYMLVKSAMKWAGNMVDNEYFFPLARFPLQASMLMYSFWWTFHNHLGTSDDNSLIVGRFAVIDHAVFFCVRILNYIVTSCSINFSAALLITCHFCNAAHDPYLASENQHVWLMPINIPFKNPCSLWWRRLQENEWYKPCEQWVGRVFGNYVVPVILNT